ncbi:hypothetical protein CW751_05115 [Brumimicrobium salinarum]|uniref:Protein BatD n=2 Tax=Brumimicrobium salinarum TaxID=2058658 RepID=A0A2I0R4F0_9FLAO|nr:hypothetical protein CW751_05115 [Brumimicrobium salinarum]
MLGQELKMTIETEEVLIGEPFSIHYSVISEEKIDSLIFFDQEDTFSAKISDDQKSDQVSSTYDLEILTAFTDTNYQSNGRYVWRGTYEVTGWDSAYVIIPPELIYIEDSMYVFPAGLVHITSPTLDPNHPLYDINESFTELPQDKFLFLKSYWFFALILALIIALVFIYFKRKPKKEQRISLRAEFLGKIDRLEKSKSFETNLKEYYYDLSIILRRFFAAHLQEQILDKTTGEIEVILTKYGLDQEKVLLTRKLLTQSDMVKFARSTPSIEEVKNVTNYARKIVNEIADLELKDE